MTADEKISELQSILEHSTYENRKLILQMESVGKEKLTFVRERIDELVGKEV